MTLSKIKSRMVLGAKPALSDYGIVSSVTRDYSNAEMQSAFTRCAADGHREMFVPAGNYRLGEQIWMHDGVTLVGENASWSVFKFYHAESGFAADGLNSVGGGLKNLSVVNDTGGLAVAYVQLVAALAGYSPDFFTIDRCNFTGFNGATVQYGIVADGNARDGSAPNLLKGVRNLNFSDTDIFNATILNIDLRQARGCALTNISHYQASGSVTKLGITGADANRASFNIRATGCTFGDVSIDYASKVIMTGCDINGLTIANTASQCRIAHAFGAVSNNGIDSVVIT